MSTEIEDAVDTLQKAFEADPDFAHTWHCNVAMACFDSIPLVEYGHEKVHEFANEAASRFMKKAFDVETSG